MSGGGYLMPCHNNFLLKRSPSPKAPPLIVPPEEASPFIVQTLIDSTTHRQITQAKTQGHTLGPLLRTKENLRRNCQRTIWCVNFTMSLCFIHPNMLFISKCTYCAKANKTKQNLDHHKALYAFILEGAHFIRIKNK